MTNPAETYEREMVPVLFEPWAAALLDHAQLTGGERILDIACGTGVVARRAARRMTKRGHVTGVDLNPNMIAVARAAAERERGNRNQGGTGDVLHGVTLLPCW